MSCNEVLSVHSLHKNFRLYAHTYHRLLELVSRKTLHRDFTALKDISFAVDKGEALGIIGENGSGKSTLLKLIAGILTPDKGKIHASGQITGLLELGTGFNPELSGRANIYLNGIYLGLDKKKLKQAEEAITEFAELDAFIDEPLKSYSSGMIMRLGFAIAIHTNPACFIIDEALSVGDARFQQKCFNKMAQYREAGGSVLFVSHDLNAIRSFCDRVMLLSHGQMQYLGEPEHAVNLFYQLLSHKGSSGNSTVTGYGNGLIQFQTIQLTTENDAPASAFISGQPMRIHFSWATQTPIPDVTFGFTIRDRLGQDIFGTNGALLHTLVNVAGPGHGYFEIAAINLTPGNYTINLAAHTGVTHLENCFHWWDNAAGFEILEDLSYRFCGIARLPVQLRIA